MARNADYEDEENGPSLFEEIFRGFKFLFKVLLAPFRLLGSVFGLLNSLRNTILTFFTFLILAIFLLIYILVFKPPFLWEPLKTFLNADLNPPQIQEVSLENVYAKINQDGIHKRQTNLSESEMTSLFRKKLNTDLDLRVDIKEHNLRLLINPEPADKPLWIIFDFTESDTGKMELTNIGVNRIGLPQSVVGYLNQQFSGMISFLESQIAQENLSVVISKIWELEKIDKSLRIKDAKLEEDKIIINFTLERTINQ